MSAQIIMMTVMRIQHVMTMKDHFIVSANKVILEMEHTVIISMNVLHTLTIVPLMQHVPIITAHMSVTVMEGILEMGLYA